MAIGRNSGGDGMGATWQSGHGINCINNQETTYIASTKYPCINLTEYDPCKS